MKSSSPFHSILKTAGNEYYDEEDDEDDDFGEGENEEIM